jgi:glycopeptide antibiotics resistance protein
MLRGQTAAESLNLIPLFTLSLNDLKTSLLNVLLFVPFGFGLPFISNFSMRKIILLGALFSITIELLQFITGLIAHMTFRVADINDVIFNTLGTVVGYLLVLGLLQIKQSWNNNLK